MPSPGPGDSDGPLGHPRAHFRRTDSTNDRARSLAEAGAPHGTTVTAAEQTAGRGRQGRRWTAPAGRALLASVILRSWPRVAPLAAGVAVAQALPGSTALKWPNDVLLDGRKVAGILVEGRPREGWAIVGVGVNLAVRPEDFPAELRETAATLALEPGAVEPVLGDILGELGTWLDRTPDEILAAYRQIDWLHGRDVRWASGQGRAAGLDDEGRLLVESSDGDTVALDAGEVHLQPAGGHSSTE